MRKLAISKLATTAALAAVVAVSGAPLSAGATSGGYSENSYSQYENQNNNHQYSRYMSYGQAMGRAQMYFPYKNVWQVYMTRYNGWEVYKVVFVDGCYVYVRAWDGAVLLVYNDNYGNRGNYGNSYSYNSHKHNYDTYGGNSMSYSRSNGYDY